MELRDYLKLIVHHIWIFILVIVVCTAAAYFYSKKKTTTYTATNTITVTKNSNLKQSQVNYYLFDNYYNLQSANTFASTVTSWFSSAAFVKEIYQNAGVDLPSDNASDLSTVFTATPNSVSTPSTINISVSGADQEQLTKLIDSAATIAQKETDSLNSNSDSLYQINKFDPIISINSPKVKTNTLVGLLSGIILAYLMVLGIAYFKKENIK